jgi:hypothetical protein
MKMKMQRLALGAKWGGFGARGLAMEEELRAVLAVRIPSEVRSAPRAARPSPEAVVAQNSRRVMSMRRSCGVIAEFQKLFSADMIVTGGRR